MDAFVQIVAEKGYESAGIKLICQRAGVAPGTFYELAQSKEQLFLDAYDAGVQILFREARIASLAEEHASWPEKVEAGLGAFLRALADNPAFARFFALEIHKAGVEARNRVSQSFDAAAVLFGQAEPASGFTSPIREIAPLVIGGVYTRIYFYIQTGRTAELPDLSSVLTQFVLAFFTTGH